MPAHRSYTFFIFSLIFLTTTALHAQKFLGNIYQYSNPSNFLGNWNQVTPENSGKWDAAEPSRDNMSWGNLDKAYNYAKNNQLPFKQHTFVWGNQEPNWIGNLSQAEQLEEVEEWIKLYAQRYPNTDFVDVVNEPLHAPASYRQALGGNGTTGWDWVVKSFELARQYLPNTKLLINEYGIISDMNAAAQYLEIINILNQKGLLDGIGLQCHAFNMNDVSTSTMNQVLDLLGATGLPIYVSELDLEGSDSEQLQRYRLKFPVFWEHASVQGVTLWGYVQGTMWREEAWMMSANGTKRPAMDWLMQYVHGHQPDNDSYFDTCEHRYQIRATGVVGDEEIYLAIGGQLVKTFTLSTTMDTYTATSKFKGNMEVVYTNDIPGRDVQLDYLMVDSLVLQAEDMADNTAAYQTTCGDGSYTEMMHCNGAISFGQTPDCQAGEGDISDALAMARAGAKLYPNPATNSITLTVPTAETALTLYNHQGIKLKEINMHSNRQRLDISDLAPGLYILRSQNTVLRFIKN